MPDNISNSGDTLLDYGLDEEGKKQVSPDVLYLQTSDGMAQIIVGQSFHQN